jgi:8-oxo-dGTP pyrophosphatase MutT (NUDIX family)
MIKSAGGILKKEINGLLHILVVHRMRYNDWSFPKGKCLEGESFEHAAVREVKEETGIDAEIEKHLKDVFYSAKGEKKITVYFLMKIINENTYLQNDETDEIKWASREEASGLLSYNELKSLIKLL